MHLSPTLYFLCTTYSLLPLTTKKKLLRSRAIRRLASGNLHEKCLAELDKYEIIPARYLKQCRGVKGMMHDILGENDDDDLDEQNANDDVEDGHVAGR